MLLRAIVLIVIIAFLAETIVTGAAALGRASLHAQEMQLVRNGLGSAIESAQNASISHTIPQPQATCAYSQGGSCMLTMQTTIAQATEAPQTAACPSTDCTITEQNSANVSESRASYQVMVSLDAQNGDQLVERNGVVSFRTFAEPPYATLVGSLDGTLDTLMNGGASDDGGSTSQAHSTLIHVQYQQPGGAFPVEADVWRAQQQQPASVSQPWVR